MAEILTRAELDKARGTTRSGFAGSPFTSSSAPAEFAPLISFYSKVTKLSSSLKGTVSNADSEYHKHTDASAAPPSAPVFAARLNGLLKTLANAENAVEESVKARQSLISGLEKMLDDNRAALASEEKSAAELSMRKSEIEEKKQQVEVAIMRALGPADNEGSDSAGGAADPDTEPHAPEMEALTPPAGDDGAFEPWNDTLAVAEVDKPNEKGLEESGPDEHADSGPGYHSVEVSTNGSKKRRRVDDPEDFPDLGGDDDIDNDVAEMLKEGDGGPES